MMRTCDRPGCGQRHLARGLCSKHYSQAMRDGTAPAPKRATYAPGQECMIPGCTMRVAAKHYCHHHYDILARPRCETSWCTRPRRFADGFCSPCHRWILRTVEARRRGAPEPDYRPPSPRKRLSVECPHGCGRDWHLRPATASPIPQLRFTACPGSAALEGLSA